MKGDITLYKLTNRELEVLKLVAQGYTAKEIGHVFGTRKETVRNQIQTAKLKLGARNSAHAVAIAKDRSLI